MNKLKPPSISKRFDVIFFDLGNTLLYFDESWSGILELSSEALTYQLMELGYELDKKQFIQAFQKHLHIYQQTREIDLIEKPTEKILQEELSKYGFDTIPFSHLRLALDKMYAVSQKYWLPEEDTLSTIEKLHTQGYHLGIISNAKDSKDVQQLIDKAGIRSFLNGIFISSDIGYRKPHPQIFRVALEEIGVQPDRTVMVGDILDADILGAKNMSIANVWITRRADTLRNKAAVDTIHPDKTISTLSELPKLLANW
jgi:putative hydrolase of the HAD superfamily